MEQITIDDFAKIDIRIGEILSVETVEGADKLLKLMIDVGETDTTKDGVVISKPRQILSGIREYFSNPEVLIGVQVPVLTNLAPRMIRGLESSGMVLYAVAGAPDFTALHPLTRVPNGTLVR